MIKIRVATVVSAVLGLATATAAFAAVPANAKVVDKEHFHDSFVSDPYDCEGVTAVDSVEVAISITAVQRGPHLFPYFRQHAAGSVVTTNTATGGTFTNVFASNSQDHTITNNGDGTITITTYAAGGSRYYDQFGKLVLKDPGSFRFAVDIDYNGTPGDPSDDSEVPDSFRVVRASTGNSDLSTRDFCADLAQFTTP
jgi:hypothetical protein